MSTVTDYKKLFEENNDFHDYVLRYIKKNGKTIETALREKIVKEVGDYYLNLPTQEDK